MTQLTFARRLLLSLTLIAICATLAASASRSRERRHVGIEKSSHDRSDKVHAPKSSNGANNEITAEPGRKVSHHLIGGHLRAEPKRQGDEEETLWDDGILMSAAGNGKEGKSARASGADDEDEKKTLSQQVKEGKYGLIQNEIYGDRPKRPGIISYLGNPEVPKDTVDNLGGLNEEDIWLAENHMLVLRGGKFPEDGQQGSGGDDGASSSAKWPPIDDYKAPRRQVKIPARPRVPPPFPVQLTDGGPVQIIAPDGSTTDVNDTLDYGTDSAFSKGLLPEGENNPFFSVAPPNGTTVNNSPERNFSGEEKSSRGGDDDHGRPDAQPPSFYHAIPPGAVFVPPPGNQSDYDEEDQSIYYPPPYSFYYPQDNTTAVPPGPLVPGIILPPPPDFFAAMDDKKPATKKYAKRPTYLPPPPPTTTTMTTPRMRPAYLPARKFATKQHKSSSPVLPTSVTKTTVSSTVTAKMTYGRTAAKNHASKHRPGAEETTEPSRKLNTLENTEMYAIGPVNGNEVSEAMTQQKDWSTLVTSKTVLAYYPSTTQSSLEQPVEVTPASVKSIITAVEPGKSSDHASYYFYAESNEDESGVTSKPSSVYYKTNTESPSYYDVGPRQTEQKKHFYTVETPKDYKTKLIDSIVKNSQTFQYTEPGLTSSEFDTSSPHSQRMLADQAPVYYQPPSHSLKLYYTSPKPPPYHQPSAKPIYQYSFQVGDYAKRNGNQAAHQHQEQNAPYSEYHDIKSDDRRYGDYEDIDSPSRQQSPRKTTYKTQRPLVYPTRTSYSPVADTTPNPQHAYFTQQDEKLLDDVTKEYFTIFGKKLPDNGIPPSTTPIYSKSSGITERPTEGAYVSDVYRTTSRPVDKTPNVDVNYGDQQPFQRSFQRQFQRQFQRPISLHNDTRVNYQRPFPTINPESEFIDPIRRQQQLLQDYELIRSQYYQPEQPRRPSSRYRLSGAVIQSSNNHNNHFRLAESREELEQKPVSLLDDIKVNFGGNLPINPEAEFIKPVSTAQEPRNFVNPNAYFIYRLPGDVSHFYFRTPVTQQQDPIAGYVYQKPKDSRSLRQRRRQGDA